MLETNLIAFSIYQIQTSRRGQGKGEISHKLSHKGATDVSGGRTLLDVILRKDEEKGIEGMMTQL